MNMTEPGDEVFFRVGGILHEARMEECYGKMEISTRRKWPETFKDFRRQRMDGQPSKPEVAGSIPAERASCPRRPVKETVSRGRQRGERLLI
jgi:hypothetical protein